MKREPFERVVECHGPTVLRVCRALVGPVAADDAWSETFLAAMTAYPNLAPDSNLEAWLVTIAHRKAIDQLRLTARQPVPVPDLGLEGARAAPGVTAGGHPDGAGADPDDEVMLGYSLAQGLEGPLDAVPDLGSVPYSDNLLDPWPAVLRLPLRQRQAIAYHYVAGLPYATVAEIADCSPESARRAGADGIAALRVILTRQEAP